MALQKPFEEEPAAAPQSVPLNRLQSVGGAARVKAAAVAHHVAERGPIETNGEESQ